MKLWHNIMMNLSTYVDENFKCRYLHFKWSLYQTFITFYIVIGNVCIRQVCIATADRG